MRKTLERTRGSGNVFRDLGFDKVEAENLRLRSALMMRIEQAQRASGMTQSESAKLLDLTPVRMKALLKGKLGQFSLDDLVMIAVRAGLDVRLSVRKSA